MKAHIVPLLLTLAATGLSSAIPPSVNEVNEHKTRIIDKDLSDREHFKDPEHQDHNPEYDHEAFLGREDAKTFDDLTPEESKVRLGLIFDKIDKDDDNFVTEEELKDWIKHVQNRYVKSDTERQWKNVRKGKDTEVKPISWEEYKTVTYGFMEGEDEDEDDDGYSYKDMMRRDERRWKAADLDEDRVLTKEEYASFLHPEDAAHMREIVIDETIEDIDKDKDGFISVEEYVDDMDDDSDDDEDDDESWQDAERKDFVENRDKNGDGRLDKEEVTQWIFPGEADYVANEAEHLMDEADEDEDDKLSKEEVISKYDVFVGSQATDFGEALAYHDEL